VAINRAKADFTDIGMTLNSLEIQKLGNGLESNWNLGTNRSL